MSSGTHENVAKASDYQVVDPTGAGAAARLANQNLAQYGMEGLNSVMDPNAAMNAFLGQAPGLANLAMGPTSQLTEQLNAIAANQAREGIQTMGTEFAGMGAYNSGASAAAMAEAAMNPFAQVAAQQQQNQLNLTGNLWDRALGGAYGYQNMAGNLFGGLAGQGIQGQTNLAMNMSGMMAPQYQYKPGMMDYGMQLGGMALGGLGTAGALGWQPFE